MPVQADDRETLRDLLATRDAGGIIFTTVQKFSRKKENAHPILNGRSNIVVISDEAHRSQAWKPTWIVKPAYKYGYAKHMRDAT